MRPAESFIGNPVRSLQTMLQVLAVDDKSLPFVVPDGIYSPLTANAVAAFQRREGLAVTGITNQETWDRIVKNYEPVNIKVGKAQPIQISLDPGQVLRPGDSSPYIYLLQAMLTQLASEYALIPRPGNNGVLDIETSAALVAFQDLAGLPITGELDKTTWKHLVHHFTSNASSKHR